MMLSFYRLAEVAIYSLLNFLPFLALALYPFRHSLRFSIKTTFFLIGSWNGKIFSSSPFRTEGHI